MLELAVKISVTILAAVIIWGIGSFTAQMWRSQIDVNKTIKNAIESVQTKPTDVLALRDSLSIYQNGEVVGKIHGPISETGDYLTFTEMSDTSELDRKQTIEFRRHILEVESIEASTGQKINMDDTGKTQVFTCGSHECALQDYRQEMTRSHLF